MKPQFASGAKFAVNYVPELVFGTTPVTPAMKKFRIASGSKFEVKRNTFTSKETRPDRQIADMRYGNKRNDISIPGELSYGSFDDFLEAFCGGTWAVNVLKSGNIMRSFSIETQSTDIGNCELNRGCCVTGLDISVQLEKIVDVTFTIVGKDLLMAETLNQSIAVDSVLKTFTRLAGNFTKDGWMVGMPALGVGFPDAGNNGVAASPFIITDVTPTVITWGDAVGLVTQASAPGMGLVMGSVGVATDVTTNAPYDSFTGAIKEGGAVIGYITGITLKGTQNLSPTFALMNDSAQDITQGLSNINGTVTAYFKNQYFKQKFLNGTPSTIEFSLGKDTKVLDFLLPKIYYTGNSRSIGETTIVENIPFQAVLDPVTGTNIQITRTP